jgi:hypothetical protein
MVGEILYFFVHYISHMDYSGIEPGAVLKYPPTKNPEPSGQRSTQTA